MLRQLWRAFLVLVAGVLGAAAAGAAEAQPQRIVAIGDLHGDFDAWRDIALAAGLVDRGGRWVGGSTVAVQVGDVVDRGPKSRKLVMELIRLQRDARRKGGQLIVLVGNHEAMNIVGDLRYVTPEEYAEFATRKSKELRDRLYESRKTEIAAHYRSIDPELTDEQVRDRWFDVTPLGWVEHRLAWAPDGDIGRWVIGNPAAAIVGDTLFVHGGISSEYASLSVEEINRQVASALKATDRSPQSILTSILGPLWYRGLISRDPQVTEIPPGPERPAIEAELEAVLSAYGVKRIVIGHTPSKSGIHVEHGGRLVRIDSGNSRYYGGKPSWIEIRGSSLTVHSVDRSGK